MTFSAPSTVIIAGLVINIAVAAYALHKIRRIHLMEFGIKEGIESIYSKHLVDLHQQIQALETLRREIGPEIDLNPTRGSAASPDLLLLMARYVREARPNMVAECGSGTSTIVLARCVQMNRQGHVFALEHDSRFAEMTRRNLARQGLSDWATVIDAPLKAWTIEGKSLSWY